MWALRVAHAITPLKLSEYLKSTIFAINKVYPQISAVNA